MRSPRVIALGLMALGAALFPLPAATSHGDNPWRVETVTWFAHNFTDPAQPAQVMDLTPPMGETPQTGTCTECAGRPFIEYNFTSVRGFDVDTDVDADDGGSFDFWIRAYQPAAGAPVGLPPLQTNVFFRLFLLDASQTLVGQASVSDNITGSEPVEFQASFTPHVALIPAGVPLLWNVQISGPQDRYSPAAAPYGVSEEFPFSVSLARIVTIPDVTLRLARTTLEPATAVAGASVDVPFTLTYSGPKQTYVYLEVTSGGGGTVILDPNGQPTGALAMNKDETFTLQLRVKEPPAGLQTYVIQGLGTKGESASTALEVDAQTPAPTTQAKKDSPDVGAALLLALVGLAVGLRRRLG